MPNNFISNGSRLAIVYFDTCLSRKSKYLIDIVSSIRKLQNIVGKARVIPGFALGRTYMRNWQFAREAQDIVEPFLDQSISFIFEYVLCEHKTDHGICRQYGSIAELSLQFPRLACHTRNIFFFKSNQWIICLISILPHLGTRLDPHVWLDHTSLRNVDKHKLNNAGIKRQHCLEASCSANPCRK